MPDHPRIVIKFGTGVLSRSAGRALDSAQFKRFASEIAEVIASGSQCIVVSSAAIAAGVHALGLTERPTDLIGKQACAAAGQPELMRLYASAFARHKLRVAQLLLTHGDIDSLRRRHNTRNTIDRLLASNDVVPILNENDSVAVEELQFGDNDRLSAEVARLVDASRLVLVTSSDGILDPTGHRVPVVNDLEAAFAYVRPDKGALSVGGMKTKLEAVQIATAAGIPATIVDGRRPAQIPAAIRNEDAGTRFPLPARKKTSRP